MIERIRVVDSHTEGEPTRVVLEGGPELGGGTMADRMALLASQHDQFRRSVILEPRGHDAMVGALLCTPTQSRCTTGVIFFNNSGYLGMCGHGAMGVAVTLAHLGMVDANELIQLETPVGIVSVALEEGTRASVENVHSYVFREDVAIDIPEFGVVTGDVAWGGNWFFLTNNSPCDLVHAKIDELTRFARLVRNALSSEGITGKDGAEIDHIEIIAAPFSGDADSRNFVLCPGGAYDRSPCGTGTSAKLASLYRKGALSPGEGWVQESVIGGRFHASFQEAGDGGVLPTVSGRAYVYSEATLLSQAHDPFAHGIQ